MAGTFLAVSVKREKPLGTDGEVADTGGVRGSVPDTSPRWRNNEQPY